MAKVTKQSSKSSTKKTKKTEEVHKVAPEIPLGMISIAMSRDDMNTFANLMTLCAKTFEELAIQAAEQKDDSTFSVLHARYKLSTLFAEKLVEACRMPEPTSRDIH